MADQRKVPDSLPGKHHEGFSDDAGRNTSTPALRVIPSAFDGESFAVLPLFVFYLLLALGLTGWSF